MKKLIIALGLVSSLSLYATPQAEAIFIVDTGTPVGGINVWSLANNNADSYQFLAGQFVTTQSYNLNNLEGWISLADQGGDVDAVLYKDDSGLPDLFNELFRQSFNVPVGDTGVYDWRGSSGINFDLNAGTYWLAFEPVLGSSMTMIDGAPNLSGDITNYAYHLGKNGEWRDYPLNIGLRIDANEGDVADNVVPEPATFLLFGAGMIGAFVRQKDRDGPLKGRVSNCLNNC